MVNSITQGSGLTLWITQNLIYSFEIQGKTTVSDLNMNLLIWSLISLLISNHNNRAIHPHLTIIISSQFKYWFLPNLFTTTIHNHKTIDSEYSFWFISLISVNSTSNYFASRNNSDTKILHQLNPNSNTLQYIHPGITLDYCSIQTITFEGKFTMSNFRKCWYKDSFYIYWLSQPRSSLRESLLISQTPLYPWEPVEFL